MFTRFSLAVVVMSGCSFALVKGPPSNPTPGKLDFCTSSYGMPALVDVALAAVTTPLAIAAGVATGAYVERNNDGRDTAKAVSAGLTVGAIGLTIPVTLAISSIWGYRTANRCSSYQLEYAAQQGVAR